MGAELTEEELADLEALETINGWPAPGLWLQNPSAPPLLDAAKRLWKAHMIVLDQDLHPGGSTWEECNGTLPKSGYWCPSGHGSKRLRDVRAELIAALRTERAARTQSEQRERDMHAAGTEAAEALAREKAARGEALELLADCVEEIFATSHENEVCTDCEESEGGKCEVALLLARACAVLDAEEKPPVTAPACETCGGTGRVRCTPGSNCDQPCPDCTGGKA